MADLSDVMSKIADLATTACYPSGTSGVSVTTRRIYIMQGWPKPQDMDQAMAGNYALVNIYAIQGSSGIAPQVFEKPQIIVPAVTGLSASIDDVTGTIVTLSGTPQVGEYVTLIVDKRAYSYLYSSGNTAADFAAGLVALIIADYPLARSDGSSLTIPGSHSIVARIGAPTTLGRTIHRQTQQIRVVVWANNPTDRDTVAAAIDVFLKQSLKISFADTSEAIVNYQGTYLDDNLQNTGEYRRDLIFTVTYATVEKFPGYAITSVGFSYSITTIAAIDPAAHLPVGASVPPPAGFWGPGSPALDGISGPFTFTGLASRINVGLPAISGSSSLSGSAAAMALGTGPAFSADFTGISSLPSWLSFPRASNAMVFDSTGKMTYAPNNLLLQSNTFTDAAWTPRGTIVSGGVSDPIGGSNAFTITSTSTNSDIYSSPIFTEASKNYITSIWVRRRTGTGPIRLMPPSMAAFQDITVTSSWTQVFLVGPGAGSNSFCDIQIPTIGDAIDVYSAVYSLVTYETTPRTLDQVITTSAADYGPRSDFAWNGSAWVAVGLLIEEQQTNVVYPSVAFGSGGVWGGSNVIMTDNAAVAPDGTTTATKVKPTGTVHPVVYGAVTNSGLVTHSVFAKAGEYTKASLRIDTSPSAALIAVFDLNAGTVLSTMSGLTASIQSIGNGWYRLIGTRDAGGTPVDTYTQFGPVDDAYSVGSGDIVLGAADSSKGVYFWGADQKAHPFATSYIPTTTAAVTRSADIAQLAGAALALMQGSAFTAIIETSNVLFGATILMGNGNNGFIAASWDTHTAQSYNGISSILAPFPSGLWSDIQRCAYAGDAVGRSFVASGGTLSTDTGPFEGSTPTFIAIGNNSSSGQIDGYVRSLALYSTRLSDADLQTKSVVGASF